MPVARNWYQFILLYFL